MKKSLKLLIAGASITAGVILALYLIVIPCLISNQKVMNFICQNIGKSLNADINVKNPKVKTALPLKIDVQTDNINVISKEAEVLTLEDLHLNFSLKKKVVVNKFELGYIFVDTNPLIEMFPAGEASEGGEMPIDLYDSILSLKKALILYSPDKDTTIKLTANNLFTDNTQKIERPVHFDIDTEINKAGKVLNIGIADQNKVLIKNKQLFVNDCILDVDKSKVYINAYGSRQRGLELNLDSKNFRLEDVNNIVSSNLILNNGSEIMSYFKDMKGTFDFHIKLTPKSIDGNMHLNSLIAMLTPLADLPVKLDGGDIILTSKQLTLKDFNGYYGSNKSNGAKIYGTIKDYMKSCDTEINIDTAINNEFTKNYLSKVAGADLETIGRAGTKIIIKSIYDKIDICCMSKLAKGDDILVFGQSLTPTTYDRAVKADMHIEKNILDIKNINYYIASEIKKGVKVKPVLTLKGIMDISKPVPDIKEFGFEIPNPLPSEFLNLFAGPKTFKGGKFSGNLFMVNNGTYPVIQGNLIADEIRIPSQRLFIRHGELNTTKDIIHLSSNGRFKRSEFTFTGDIANGIKYPIVIKDVRFGLDKIDVEKLLTAQNNQTAQPVAKDDDDEEGNIDFDISNLIIEKCVFSLKEGKYKEVNFGNLTADLTLNKNSIMELKSNRFDIADGISSVKVYCDLKKHKYNLRLGVKDVNTEIMASSLLNLPREISGKARGLIEINTDDSLKLNGQVKFDIKDGEIQKIGLVQYLLKFAALFRNPIVMISPSTIGDIINIPEGNFEKITGEIYLKNNIAEFIRIKSSSPQLGCYIVGRYNLENGDAILRIYTKFSNKNKGAAGFLRNISLNSLANRIPLSSRNDVDYYASELANIPEIDAEEKDCQIFLTKVDGDIEHNNFLSSLKKIK